METYMFLIYEDEASWSDDPEGDTQAWDEAMVAHGAFSQAVLASGGTLLGGEALKQTPAARTVRKGVVTDGPFAETKESLGGFYLIGARDLDHAMELAAQCPAGTGCVEVRPTVDTGGAPQPFEAAASDASA